MTGHADAVLDAERHVEVADRGSFTRENTLTT